MLRQQIQQQLISALKSHDEMTLSTLRYLMSGIKNIEIDSKKELTDEEVIVVIRKQLKQLNEALELFKKGGRTDLASQNEAQIKILSRYLPEEVSDQDLKVEIEKVIADNQEVYDKNKKAIIGITIKALKEKASPDRIMKILSGID